MKLKTKVIGDLTSSLYEIPFFLDAKDPDNWRVWKQIRSCNRVIRNLLVSEILSDIEISDIFLDFCVAYKLIERKDFDIEIWLYFDNLIHYILGESIELEFYETASNLKKYQAYYCKKLTNDEN